MHRPSDLLAAAQVQGVQALLLVDPVRHLGEVADGLHQLDLAVVASLLIGDIIEIIHESTQEVAFAELHDLDGGILEDIAVVASLSQNLVVQSFHLCVLLFASSLSISCRVHTPLSHTPILCCCIQISQVVCASFLEQKGRFCVFPADFTIPQDKFWHFFSCIQLHFSVY